MYVHVCIARVFPVVFFHTVLGWHRAVYSVLCALYRAQCVFVSIGWHFGVFWRVLACFGVFWLRGLVVARGVCVSG